jgi:hypothetical protein
MKILRYALIYLAGVATVLLIGFVLLMGSVKQTTKTMADTLLPEAKNLDISIIFEVNEAVDVEQFTGMNSDKIVKKMNLLPPQEIALQHLFDSDVKTEVKFKWEDEKGTHSASFYCESGVVKNTTLKSNFSIEVNEKKTVFLESAPKNIDEIKKHARSDR